MIPLGTMGQWDTWDTFVKTFPTTSILRQPDYCKRHTSVRDFCIYNDQGHDKCRLQVKMNYSGYHLQSPLVLPRRGDEDYSVSG